MPNIDLSRYTFSAMIDRLKLEVTSTGATTSTELSYWLKAARYFRLEVEKHGKIFQITMQYPHRSEVLRLLEALAQHAELKPQVRVSAVDIAIDIYVWGGFRTSKSQREHVRWMLTEVLWRHFLPPSEYWDRSGAQPRWNAPDEEAEQPLWKAPPPSKISAQSWSSSHAAFIRESLGIDYPTGLDFLRRMDPENYHQPFVNGMIRLGKSNGSTQAQIFHDDVVEFDESAGFSEWIFGTHRCVRILASVQGDELRRNNLDRCENIGAGLRHLRRKFFKFWLPTVPLINGSLIHPTHLERFERGGVFAVRQAAVADRERQAYLNRQVKGRRIRKGWPRMASDDHEGLHAYSALNTRCADALRRLEKTWARLD